MYEYLSNKFQHMYFRDVESLVPRLKIDKNLNIKLKKINLNAKKRQGSRSPSRYWQWLILIDVTEEAYC